MLIQYHGDACVRLSGKHAGEEFVVLIDPYDAKKTGLKTLHPSTVHCICSTTGALPAFGEGPFVITGPGEYAVRGVSVLGIPVGVTTIYRIEAEEVSLAHLGHFAGTLDDATIERLGDVDVLFVPVGGNGVCTAKQANVALEQIEPRIAIPIQYRVRESTLPYDGPEAFCKEAGCSPKDAEERIRVTEKEIPTDEMVVKMLLVS